MAAQFGQHRAGALGRLEQRGFGDFDLDLRGVDAEPFGMADQPFGEIGLAERRGES